MKQHPDSHRFSPLSTSRPPFSRFAPCPPLSHSLNAANKNNTALSATREHHRREAEGSWIHVNYKNNSAKRSNNRPLHSQCLARRVVSREKSPHSRPVTTLPLLSLLFLSFFHSTLVYPLIVSLDRVKIVGKIVERRIRTISPIPKKMVQFFLNG